jgi:hypothetical protein
MEAESDVMNLIVNQAQLEKQINVKNMEVESDVMNRIVNQAQ